MNHSFLTAEKIDITNILEHSPFLQYADSRKKFKSWFIPWSDNLISIKLILSVTGKIQLCFQRDIETKNTFEPIVILSVLSSTKQSSLQSAVC